MSVTGIGRVSFKFVLLCSITDHALPAALRPFDSAVGRPWVWSALSGSPIGADPQSSGGLLVPPVTRWRPGPTPDPGASGSPGAAPRPGLLLFPPHLLDLPDQGLQG